MLSLRKGMKTSLLRLVPAAALAAPIALGLYARPAAQGQAAPSQPAAETPAAPAQTPATPNFRTDINYVRVDVIVSDKTGAPVNDLRQQDFEITEDGKPQTIQSFKLVNITETSAATPVSVPRRIMIMISIVVGSTLYSTTLLIVSTLLPQMQGAMAATQD